MTSIEESVSKIDIFQNCDQESIKNLVCGAQILEHNKGKIVFLSGGKAERYYYIAHGWMKLFRETLDGSQAVIDILTTGHIFGETSIFEEDTYPYTAEVVSGAKIISLPLKNLKREIKSNNDLALSMLNSMARYRRQQEKEIEHKSLQNASQRIGCFLLRLANQNETGAITIHLPYDKILVASRLGMQPETFSRALSKLRDKTGIRIKGATIEADNLMQISNYSCSGCSSHFPCKDLNVIKSR